MKAENNRPHGTGRLGRHGINESCVIATLMPPPVASMIMIKTYMW